MITIEVNNSYSKINGLASTPFNKLRKALSYSTDAQAAYFSGGNYNRLRYCIDKQGNFPTGLLPRVKAFLEEQHIKFDISDRRLLTVLGIHKVDHKPNFAGNAAFIWQMKASQMVEKEHRAIISAPTGSGKSFVIALILARLSVKTLIVVPSLQIKEQMILGLKAIFADMTNIHVENIDSSALKKPWSYDCLIIDEAHHVAAKTYQRLNKTAWSGIYYRVFLTATPFRNQTEETLLFEGIAGSTVFKLSYKEAVAKGYIAPIEAYYIEVPKIESDAFTWAQVYSQLVVNNKSRNEIIAEMLLNLSLAGVPTLCLVKEINHGKILSDLTGIAFANGQDEDTRVFIGAFNKGQIKSLIGTTGILGEGIDTKPCQFVVIAGLGKAKSAFMQQVGRAVRTFPGKESGKVIIIKDRSHKFLTRHFNAQCQILLDEYGVKPIKLEI